MSGENPITLKELIPMWERKLKECEQLQARLRESDRVIDLLVDSEDTLDMVEAQLAAEEYQQKYKDKE